MERRVLEGGRRGRKEGYPFVEEVACWRSINGSMVAGVSYSKSLYSPWMDGFETRDEAGRHR